MTEGSRRVKKQINIDFGRFVRSVREQKGLSQQEVAKRAGITDVYVSHIELGIRDPSFSKSMAVLEALGLDLSDFIEEQKKNTAAG